MWHDIVNLHLNHSEAMVVDLSICNPTNREEKEEQKQNEKKENGEEKRKKAH